MHYNCLIVDDETDLAGMTCEYFEMMDISCAYVKTAAECLEFLEEHQVDLLLLDINLEQESGFALCKKLREKRDLPILFISARQEDDDILAALNIGGDDYIKKPYRLSVLSAKVKVVLKRMASYAAGSAAQGMASVEKGSAAKGMEPVEKGNAAKGMEPVEKGSAAQGIVSGEKGGDGLRLDAETLRVFVGGRAVSLKAKEFRLFQCLYEHRNTIVSKEKLFDMVWGDSWYSDGTLNVHIRRLREKLEENPSEPKLIKTVWGTGYMLELTEQNSGIEGK